MELCLVMLLENVFFHNLSPQTTHQKAKQSIPNAEFRKEIYNNNFFFFFFESISTYGIRF